MLINEWILTSFEFLYNKRDFIISGSNHPCHWYRNSDGRFETTDTDKESITFVEVQLNKWGFLRICIYVFLKETYAYLKVCWKYYPLSLGIVSNFYF